MKFTTASITLFAIQTLAAPPTELPTRNDECGALSIMGWDEIVLPADIDRSKLRKCKEHPFGAKRMKRKDNLFEKRLCYPYTSGTCDNGYCWASCGRRGSNEAHYWCWLARDNGYGDWIKCGNDDICKTYPGRSCGVGNCNDCGCGGC